MKHTNAHNSDFTNNFRPRSQKKRSWYGLSLLLPGLLLIFTFTHCGKTGAESGNFVVLYAAEDALLIQQNGSETPLSTGSVIPSGATVDSGRAPLDMQSRQGATVRLRPYTRVAVSGLENGARMDMDHGGMVVRVNRRSADQDFTVVTPTAIAGVRGTEFDVEDNGTDGARITVHSGKVSMRPRVPALERLGSDQIESDPELQKLQSTLESREVILEANQQGSLDMQTVSGIERINSELESNAEGAGSSEIPADGLQALENENAVIKNTIEIDIRSKADLTTLVEVDEDRLAEAESAASDSDRTQAGQDLEEQYNQRRDAALDRLNELTGENPLNSAELKERYNIIEIVHQKSGTITEGAVLTQAGNILVVHTTSGVVRIDTADINYIDLIHVE